MAEIQDSEVNGLVEDAWVYHLYLVVRQVELLKKLNKKVHDKHDKSIFKYVLHSSSALFRHL